MPTQPRIDVRSLLRTPSPWSVGFTTLVALVAVTALFLHGPPPRPVAELVRSGDVFLDPRTMEPYSGPIYSTFTDRPMVIATRVNLREGAFDGLYEEYFANQRLSAKETYRNGRKDGPYEWYFESGRLFESGTYRGGRREGPYVAFWESGDIEERGTYEAGRYEGPRLWYLDGELVERVTYVDGVIHGPYERYSRQGRLEARGTLHGGVPCGAWIEAGEPVEYPACGAEVVE